MVFTANPFGLRSLGQGKDSSYSQERREYYSAPSVIFHLGDEKAAKIAEAYKAYALEK